VESIGLGSDFDGIPIVPRQLEDVSTYPVITQELLNRGYSAAEIHQIMSGNILRVMRKAEDVARTGERAQ
jgi:membrane dipeptidase